MKHLLLAIFIFSSPLNSQTNYLDKTFLNIVLDCRIFRIMESPDKSPEKETNCINAKLKENNLSKAKYKKWSESYYKKQKEAWDNFFKNLEKE